MTNKNEITEELKLFYKSDEFATPYVRKDIVNAKDKEIARLREVIAFTLEGVEGVIDMLSEVGVCPDQLLYMMEARKRMQALREKGGA